MTVDYHTGGVNTALAVYGVKSASFMGDVLRSAKTHLIGSPREAIRQIRAGELFHPEHGLYTHGLPRTLGGTALTLAIPAALTALSTYTAPPESKGETAGRVIGQLGGSILGGPLFGAVGQLGAGALLSELGGGLGKMYDRASRKEPEAVSNSDVAFTG